MPRIVVIGLGCIGGSLVRALREHNIVASGWSTSADDCAQARAHGLHVSEPTLTDSVRHADLVVIAVPAQSIAQVAAAVIASAPRDAAIVHCGGVQSAAALELDPSTTARVIGAHPLAGSHDSGFAASRSNLFVGCTVSVEARASEHVRGWMQWMWTGAGAARVEYRPASEHDALMAWISQLPQLAATALAATMAGAHVEPRSVGPGARDSTRLAASTYEQWSTLVRAEPTVLAHALSELESHVAEIRHALGERDDAALRAIWESARAWRRDAEAGA